MQGRMRIYISFEPVMIELNSKYNDFSRFFINLRPIMTPARDEETLYQAMKRMIHTSAADRAAMGIAGREKMHRQFDKVAVVKETILAIFE